MNLQNEKGLTCESQRELGKRHAFLSGIKLIHEQARYINYLAQLIFLKPSPAVLQQTDSMRYDMWLVMVADRLIELGVPADEVSEYVIDFSWFSDRFDDHALAWSTAEEYFLWYCPYECEDKPEAAMSKVSRSELSPCDPERQYGF